VDQRTKEKRMQQLNALLHTSSVYADFLQKKMKDQQALSDPFGTLADDSDVPKYRPSLKPHDPIVKALQEVLKSDEVVSFDLIDSRWNGNEGELGLFCGLAPPLNTLGRTHPHPLPFAPSSVLKYETSSGTSYFVKMNRVEDASVFVSEGVSLSALAKCECVKTPLPLHIGKLPKVGVIGPGGELS